MKSVILATLFLLLASCEKIQIAPAGSLTGAVCLNADPKSGLGSPRANNRIFNRLTFADEFEDHGLGSVPADPADCYDNDQLAVCKYRLDVGNSGICSKNVAHLKNLNKCRWKIWDGFSFWEKSDQLTFTPDNIRVQDGKYQMRIHVRPDSEGPFQCGKTNKPEDAVDYFNTNCKLSTGGIDSEFSSLGRMTGVNVKDGRIEARARMSNTVGLWPAIWMWGSEWSGQEGWPHRFSALPGREYTPEVDILEVNPEGGSTVKANQTYHMWGNQETGHRSPPVKGTLIYPGDWHTFGVERHAKELRFYVDDCYTKIIKDNDFDNSFKKTVMVDPYASFLILSMGLTTEAANSLSASLDGGLFEIDWVRIYEK